MPVPDHRLLNHLLWQLRELKRRVFYARLEANAGGILAGRDNAVQFDSVKPFRPVQDPIASGLVESLARSGGNATGLSTLAPEVGGKRLEILKEAAVAKISRIAFL